MNADRVRTLLTSKPLSSDDPAPNQEALSGLVHLVTFHNPENGFVVLRLQSSQDRRPATVIGTCASVSPGQLVHAVGSWELSKQHGRQFRALTLEVRPPSTLEGIERYLGSGLIPGIGPTYARRLVEAFGEDVLEVIENQPERLRELEGIGPRRLESITRGWTEQKAIREIMVFLQSHGVSPARAVRIYKTYGAEAIRLVTEDPYRLARDLRGIGFSTADEIATRIGIPRDSPLRARAGLSHIVQEGLLSGHCALPRADLLRLAGELLERDPEELDAALDLALRSGDLKEDEIDGEPHLFLPTIWHAERQLAEDLLDRLAGPPPWRSIDPAIAIPWAESRLEIELSASQRNALETILGQRLSVVTGGPGVGKTTLVQTLLTILQAKGVDVLLCAPTGRAAKRLSESTGTDARTIHRLLEAGPKGFKRDESNPLSCDLLVVDESSMVDIRLAAALVRALPASTALLWIGDVDQLPSVGPGRVLADIIEAGPVRIARLVEVFRQAANSSIITNAHRINRGELPQLPPAGDTQADFYFVRAENPEDGVSRILQMVSDRIPKRFGLDPRRDIQVLCPMNLGLLGTRHLNERLQTALNPARTGQQSIERFGNVYRVGDRVMQTENDYEKLVFNGDLGILDAIDHDEGTAAVRFEGRRVDYELGEIDSLALAYAVTIHKSQGSEYEAVVIPVSTQHYLMLQRNLLYTGVTRARRLVVLVGQERALALAVRRGDSNHRHTRLQQLLRSPPVTFRPPLP